MNIKNNLPRKSKPEAASLSEKFRSRLLLLSFLLISLSTFSQSFHLHYNLNKGDKFNTSFTTEMTINQSFMGIDQTINLHMDTHFIQEVSEIQEGKSFHLQNEYKRIYMRISSGLYNIEIDTDKNADEDFLISIMRSLLNKPFGMEVTTRGDIRELAGLDQIMKEALENLPVENVNFDQLMELFKGNMGDENLKQNFSQFLCIYPERPVGINDPWIIRHQLLQSDIGFNFDGTGRIIESRSDNLLVRIEGNLSTLAKAQNDLGPGQIQMQGRQVSEMVIDKNSGWPDNSRVNQEISGTVRFPSPEGDSSIEIPMQIKMRMNIKSSRVTKL